MSSITFATPLTVRLRSSPRLLALLVFAHGGGALCLTLADLPVWLIITLMLLAALSFVPTVRRYALLLSPDSVVGLHCNTHGAWFVTLGSGEARAVDALPDSFVHPFMAVLLFRDEDGHRYSAWVLPDMLPEADFCHVRAYLAVTGHHHASQPDLKV